LRESPPPSKAKKKNKIFSLKTKNKKERKPEYLPKRI